jgi:hypothetical protein
VIDVKLPLEDFQRAAAASTEQDRRAARSVRQSRRQACPARLPREDQGRNRLHRVLHSGRGLAGRRVRRASWPVL